MKKLEEIVALHEHVCEFEKTEAVFRSHAGFIALRCQHFVDGEHGADVAHEFNKIEITEPVSIVDDDRLAL